MYYIGFDIGGSSVKAALVQDRKILRSIVHDLPGSLLDLLNLIGVMRDELAMDLGYAGLAGIGFAVAGTPNKGRDIILRSYNISYLDSQPLKKMLEEKLAPYKIKMEHDINCFLLAEKKLGLAKELGNVFYLTIGTGVGSALLIDGKIQYGAHGAVGEAGHEIIDASQGQASDELEENASNKFILKTLGVGSIEAQKMAEAGDQRAIDMFRRLGKNLGIGISNIINTIDPEAVILSGGVAEAKEYILTGIKESIERYVISPDAKKTPILFSGLGRFGGALGAALLFE